MERPLQRDFPALYLDMLHCSIRPAVDPRDYAGRVQFQTGARAMAAKVTKKGKNGKSGTHAKSSRKSLAQLPALPAVWPMPKTAVDRIRVGYEDLAIQGKDTLSTLVAVNAAVSDVFERLGLELMGLARASFESAAAAGAALVDARSLEDVAAIQSEFARTCIERMIAQGARFSELGLKAAADVFEPLGARAGKAMGALGKPLAT